MEKTESLGKNETKQIMNWISKSLKKNIKLIPA